MTPDCGPNTPPDPITVPYVDGCEFEKYPQYLYSTRKTTHSELSRIARLAPLALLAF